MKGVFDLVVGFSFEGGDIYIYTYVYLAFCWLACETLLATFALKELSLFVASCRILVGVMISKQKDELSRLAGY